MRQALVPFVLAAALLGGACVSRGGASVTPEPSPDSVAARPPSEPAVQGQDGPATDAASPSPEAEPGPTADGAAGAETEAETTPTLALQPGEREPLTPAQIEVLFGSVEDQPAEHRGGVTQAREDKHYLAGNEKTLQAFYPIIKDVGGGYVGVGTDQAYLFMSWARPEIMWLVDYDPAVIEVHEIYRIFLLEAQTPEQFVALWQDEARAEALALFEAAHDEARARKLKRWYLGYRGWIRKRLAAVTRGMRKADVPCYLTDQEHYEFVQQMLQQRRVRSMVVNLLETKGLQGVSDAAQALGVPIRVLYLSNAEEYWKRYPRQYRETMTTLPFAEDAIVLRTLLTWSINTDYRYNVQSVDNYLQWLAQPYIDDVYDITHARPKADKTIINFFETDGDPEQSPAAKRWHKARAEREQEAAAKGRRAAS